MPVDEVLIGAGVTACVASSEPATVTVAPTMTAPLGSTTVTFSAPTEGDWARARGVHGPNHTDNDRNTPMSTRNELDPGGFAPADPRRLRSRGPVTPLPPPLKLRRGSP